METIIKNPGHEHISQDIFELLDKKNSLGCRLVNSSWKRIVGKPKFWLKKWRSETGLDSKRDEKILARHREVVAREMASPLQGGYSLLFRVCRYIILVHLLFLEDSSISYSVPRLT